MPWEEVHGLSKTIAREFGADRILVNTIGAGKISTRRVRQVDAAMAKNQQVALLDMQKKNCEEIPLGRYGTPEEFAKVAVFLCSEANSYVTGQKILVDGGRSSSC